MKKLLIAIIFLTLSTTALAASVTVPTSKNEVLSNAALVDYVEYIRGQDKDVKIFSISGGDPAMNGAHLNLAVFVDMETGWNVFELANVKNFTLLPSTKKDFLKIKLVKDTVDADGNIIQENSILFLNIKKSEAGSIEVEEVKQK